MNQRVCESHLPNVREIAEIGLGLWLIKDGDRYGLTAVDQTMQLLLRRLQKRTDVLLPHALNYVAALLKPLFEKVDTVDYARKSRDLKMTEEYAAAPVPAFKLRHYRRASSARCWPFFVARYFIERPFTDRPFTFNPLMRLASPVGGCYNPVKEGLPVCLLCSRPSVKRDLCKRHYDNAWEKIRAGRATWAYLIANGKAGAAKKPGFDRNGRTKERCCLLCAQPPRRTRQRRAGVPVGTEGVPRPVPFQSWWPSRFGRSGSDPVAG